MRGKDRTGRQEDREKDRQTAKAGNETRSHYHKTTVIKLGIVSVSVNVNLDLKIGMRGKHRTGQGRAGRTTDKVGNAEIQTLS